MSALPLILLIALTVFVWVVAILTSLTDDQDEPPRETKAQKPEEQSSDRRRAA